MELRVGFALFRDEIEKVPLRHEADEFAMHGQVGKIRDGDRKIVHDGTDFQKRLMRDAQELVEKTQFVNQLEGVRVNGIAAKIAEEVGVFFEDEDFNASAGDQEAKDHASGAASCDAAGGWRGLRRGRLDRKSVV